MTILELAPLEPATQVLPPPPASQMQEAPSAPRPKRRKLTISRLTNEQIIDHQLAAPDLNCVELHQKSETMIIMQGNRTLPKGFTYIARSA
ncbi:unnamed protein product [Cylindrotheca closterium]|uniref:Uncharacterized protein n=1 Tax=Cylindrotheca closterium TaxID=2856 RepID=A0AAD2CI91_9STRA|nr:unnamed protein product [Cylindrotheca closterium]